MRKITKGNEPVELTSWKRKNPREKYPKLTHIERQAIRDKCIKEQFGLCAYCCKAIDETNSMNEHVEAQNLASNRTLDFNNIVASCTTPKRCDDEHGSKPLPLTPLMDECETELKFSFSGNVEGLTERAQQSIEVLGLSCEKNINSIRFERQQMIERLIEQYDKIEDVLAWDDVSIDICINELKTPDQNGQLLAYSPVLINILSFLKKSKI